MSEPFKVGDAVWTPVDLHVNEDETFFTKPAKVVAVKFFFADFVAFSFDSTRTSSGSDTTTISPDLVFRKEIDAEKFYLRRLADKIDDLTDKFKATELRIAEIEGIDRLDSSVEKT